MATPVRAASATLSPPTLIELDGAAIEMRCDGVRSRIVTVNGGVTELGELVDAPSASEEASA